MKKLSKIAVMGLSLLVAGAMTGTALAASYGTPAEIAAGLTGQTTEAVIAARAESGSTYGAIAKEAGKLTEFKEQMLAAKKEILAQKVTAGTMTQERADAIIAAMEQNQASCDGTGSAKTGQSLNAGFGNGSAGQGNGAGGTGRGAGSGQGICSGGNSAK